MIDWEWMLLLPHSDAPRDELSDLHRLSVSLLHFFVLLCLVHCSWISRSLSMLLQQSDRFPSEFPIIFDFDKNAFCIFNSVVDKMVEQDEVRDMESPPDNGIISNPCLTTNKGAFRIMGSFNLDAGRDTEGNWSGLLILQMRKPRLFYVKSFHQHHTVNWRRNWGEDSHASYSRFP